MKRQKVGIYAAHLKGQRHYDEPSYCKGTAFLIGNEGNGLSDEIAGLADTYVRIPMEGKCGIPECGSIRSTAYV